MKSSIGLSRRAFIKIATGLGAQAIAGPALLKGALGATETLPPNSHGFRRLFPTLPMAKHDPAELKLLASGNGEGLKGMTAEPEMLKDEKDVPRRDSDGRLIITATAENKQDDEENFGVSSGYTYLGQFVDHDLTFTPGDSLEPFQQPSQANLRSARFDLDCLYGRGPADQPYLYDAEGRKLLNGRRLAAVSPKATPYDHQRTNSRAMIGDKRNDENVLVSQLHGAFRAFHNRVADDNPRADFTTLQRSVSHHYQWVLLTDFLPRICGQQMVDSVLPGFGQGGRSGDYSTALTLTKELRFGDMPLEFTMAAYRMGHSMVRPAYRINTQMNGTAAERRDNPALAGRRLIFAASQYGGLNGFRAYPDEWGIDWRLYFEIDRKLDAARVSDGKRRVQPAYKFDTSLVNPLAFLPEFSEGMRGGELARDPNGQPKPAGGKIASLPLRNLLRGAQVGLPSGQDVARAMGIDPIADRNLLVGKATVEGLDENKPITEYGDSFKGSAPLWFYVLAEAQHQWAEKARARTGTKEERDAIPNTLGPVGGRIIAETFVALMALDPNSLLHAGPTWSPRYARNGRFSMAELIEVSGLI